MIDRNQVLEVLDGYNLEQPTVGVLASHSALDVCDGAVDEGFPTLAVCQKGRERTYTEYFNSFRDPNTGKVTRGCVDEAIVLDKFSDIMGKDTQDRLRAKNTLFIPNRSLVAYAGIDAVEDDFAVPMFGSRNLLRSEERTEEKDYYWILEKAGLPFPEKLESPKDINELCIVKLHHAQKKLERGFFSASSYDEYKKKVETLIAQNVITEDMLPEARIEQYVIGPVFNFDFFYSPIETQGNPIELLGVDWRFETSLDGHVRLPAPQQMSLSESQLIPEYTVCGHNSATVRESLLEKAFPLAEKYVEACKEHYSPGVIGPFCLQTCVDKDLNFYIYDVAPRVGGGTNVHMGVGHPYGNTLWRKPVSTGRRISMEIRRALEADRLKEIIT